MVSKTVALPNVKKMFIPDEGYKMYDIDLAQADAQVVMAEADDSELRAIFADPNRDLHNENADVIFGRHDDYYRHLAKAGVHATNYLATPFTLAAALGISIPDAKHFQAAWFEAHPGIQDWHQRVSDELNSTRTVSNRFGASITFYDRSPNLLNEAVAWIPQSTVGTIINKGIKNVYDRLKNVQLLLQVHDSSAGQYPIADETEEFLLALKACFEVPVPYDIPLIIPCGLETSLKSWGDCSPQPWPLEKDDE